MTNLIQRLRKATANVRVLHSPRQLQNLAGDMMGVGRCPVTGDTYLGEYIVPVETEARRYPDGFRSYWHTWGPFIRADAFDRYDLEEILAKISNIKGPLGCKQGGDGSHLETSYYSRESVRDQLQKVKDGLKDKKTCPVGTVRTAERRLKSEDNLFCHSSDVHTDCPVYKHSENYDAVAYLYTGKVGERWPLFV